MVLCCHAISCQVVCEVMAVHWDRLDVKVAVKYPKSYGRHGTKGGNDAATTIDTKGGADEDEDEDEVKLG